MILYTIATLLVVAFLIARVTSRDWYVNRGPDPRILGRTFGVLQALLSLKTMRVPDERPQRWRPVRIIVTIGTPLPLPCLLIAVPKRGEQRWYTLRIGWRYDGWGYVADVALKTLDWDL